MYLNRQTSETYALPPVYYLILNNTLPNRIWEGGGGTSTYFSLCYIEYAKLHYFTKFVKQTDIKYTLLDHVWRNKDITEVKPACTTKNNDYIKDFYFDSHYLESKYIALKYI